MKIMVVGGGGREHTIIRKLAENKSIEKIYAMPGNGGISADAVCTGIGATKIDEIVAFAAENKIDFAVVAPDDPLALGCVDKLHAIGIPCFGPVAAAAQIEASKVFSKNQMKKYNIPTAKYETFDDAEAATEYALSGSFPVVVKADGLALGKGVLICMNAEEAKEGIKSIMLDKQFGESGNRVVGKNSSPAPKFPCWPSPTARWSSPWFPPWTTSVPATMTLA